MKDKHGRRPGLHSLVGDADDVRWFTYSDMTSSPIMSGGSLLLKDSLLRRGKGEDRHYLIVHVDRG